MKKFFLFGCLTPIVLLVLIGIAVMVLGGGAAEEAATGGESQPATEGEVAEPKKEEAKVTGVGELLEVGDAAFTVNGKETADQVGPSMLPEKASGKYVVLDVTFKNNGNEAIMVDSSFFKIKLGEKTYEADAMASISANQNEDGTMAESMFMEEVNPDSEINGKVVFDVTPEVADSPDLQLQVQSGMFGTETGIINLK